MALTGNVSASIALTDQVAGDLGSVREQPSLGASWAVKDGAGAGQATLQWGEKRTLADGASEDLDFAGTLIGLRGQTVTFTKIKALLIRALPTNTTNLTVKRPLTNGLPIVGTADVALAAIAPGGWWSYANPSAAGLAVGAGSGDLLTITNGAGAAADYQVLAVGA